MDKKTIIISILKEIDTDKLISAWNTYCCDENMEDYIYENNEYNINEVFTKPGEALRAACYGHYRYDDKYFVLNVYGSLESFEEYDAKKHIDFGMFADYIMENGCDEINDVLYEDLQYEFLRYFNEKYGTTLDAEDYERIPEDANLVTDDWDELAEEHYDEISR